MRLTFKLVDSIKQSVLPHASNQLKDWIEKKFQLPPAKRELYLFDDL